MPTGYTAAVQDGEINTLHDYTLRCARAFGALIHMREDPLEKEVPEKLVADTAYDAEKLAEAEGELAAILAMTDEECEEAAAAHYATSVAEVERANARYALHRGRYLSMLAKVRAWKPPAELIKLHEFMEKQLVDSIDWDCHEAAPPERKSAEEWRRDEIKSAQWSIKYHREKIAAEMARTAERQAWLDMLRANIPPI